MNIHIGWVGGSPPQRVHDAVAEARAICPECNVMLHADEDLVPAPRRSAIASRNLTMRQRSDIQRHAVLEAHGGLWLDVDVRLIRSPLEWAAEWDRYTAVFLIGSHGIVGTDIIYVPAGWCGWETMNRQIDATLAQERQPGILDFAHVMLTAAAAQEPDSFQFVPSGTRFAYGQRQFASDSVVARGFDPAGLTPRPAAPGLGDMIAAGLASIGITKELAQAVASKFGIDDCGCPGRQAAANRLGTYLGLPPGSTAES